MSSHGQLTMNNLPPAFTERMKNQLPDAADFFATLQTPSPVSFRLNPAKLTSPATGFFKDFSLRQVDWCRNAYYLSERPVFTLDPCLHGGGYYVQEASSMFLDLILQQILPQHPLRVLDLCAAPGGKSTLLASALPNGSLLLANEVIRNRASVLKENMMKWGTDNIVVTNNDPANFTALQGAFDLILVDAPCSGEGMFRKDSRAITEWSERNLQLCSERQKRILTDIWDSLKPGGYLVYSTCTYNPGENEAILSWLLNRYPAESISITHTFGDNITATPHGYQFYPHRISGEGFFIGVIRKKEGEAGKNPAAKTGKPAVRLPDELKRLLPQEKDFIPYTFSEGIGVIPASHAGFIEKAEKQLRILYKGCELAEINGKKIRMLQGLALYQQLQREQCTCYEASTEEALRYLKKEDILINAPAGSWVLITHNGISLGWGKSIGHRFNNYYPKEWRIRMSTE